MSHRRIRYPRVCQEKRANQEGWNRPARNPIHLPDHWSEEKWVRDQRTWKNFRSTQYKPK